MIVDAHAHTSLHPMRGLHTADASLANIEQLAYEYDLELVVLMATYFPLKGTGLHNRELLKRIHGKKLFRAFLSLDLTHDVEAGLAEIEELAQHPQVVGIKLYPGYQDFDPSGSEACKVYALTSRLQLPVALHGGELHHCCSLEQRNSLPLKCGHDTCQLDKLAGLSHPSAFEAAIRMFPEVRFLVSHLANPYFEQLRDLMRRYPNVYTDISGQFLSGSSEDTPQYRQEMVGEIRQFLELPNGTRRLLFASDFPIQSYPDSLELVKKLDLSHEESEQLLSLNAIHLLNLEGA